MKFWKQTNHIRYLLAKLSKLVQIRIQNSSDSLKIEKGMELVSSIMGVEPPSEFLKKKGGLNVQLNFQKKKGGGGLTGS